jgi:transposase
MQGPLQYGNGLKVYIISLLVCYMLSLNRVEKSIKAMIGQTISEPTLLKFLLRIRQVLANSERDGID